MSSGAGGDDLNPIPLQQPELAIIAAFLRYPARIRSIRGLCRDLCYDENYVVALCEYLKRLQIVGGPVDGCYKLSERNYHAYQMLYGPFDQN